MTETKPVDGCACLMCQKDAEIVSLTARVKMLELWRDDAERTLLNAGKLMGEVKLENEGLRKKLREARTFVQHKFGCSVMTTHNGQCDCGLDKWSES